jgi:acetyltransferase-like isoleucine patch superfamily enzyme
VRRAFELDQVIKDCEIGEGTRIWHYVNLYGCRIGRNCTIGSFVEIQKGVVIGDNVTISSHTTLCTLVEIEDDVFLGHGVVTVNDLYPPSRRRTGTDAAWKRTIIRRGASIGSNATLLPVVIGEGAVVGAGAVVTKDVPPGAVVAGNPAAVVRRP